MAATSTLPKIVIIEDDPALQMVISRFFENRFQVTVFNNGMDGLAYLQEGNIPDIIVSDLNTPQLNGYELIKQIKSSGFFNAIPIMILSGEESTESRIKCLEAGADDYLVKPFNPRELEARINVILKRSGKIFTTS
ncbi:MAG: response regulator transcription factor [Flavipsychrobacter sp.]|nr:response regulator transcription factor [Flavipsychrobacter sp.]